MPRVMYTLATDLVICFSGHFSKLCVKERKVDHDLCGGKLPGLCLNNKWDV